MTPPITPIDPPKEEGVAIQPWELQAIDLSNTTLMAAPPGVHVPPYRRASLNGWRIDVSILAANMGFWRECYPMSQIALLTGPMEGYDKPNTWMSTTAFELESQMIGLEAAKGTTVVLGFGMGWLTVNVALKDTVERVIVVERNPDIIALSEVSGVFDGLDPAMRAKIEIVEADALEWRPDCPVDSLQADIWPSMFKQSLLGDVRRMHENVQPERIYYWGQEVEFWRQAKLRYGPKVELDWPMIRDIVETDIRLPLILPDWEDYPEKIMAAVRHFGRDPGVDDG